MRWSTPTRPPPRFGAPAPRGWQAGEVGTLAIPTPRSTAWSPWRGRRSATGTWEAGCAGSSWSARERSKAEARIPAAVRRSTSVLAPHRRPAGAERALGPHHTVDPAAAEDRGGQRDRLTRLAWPARRRPAGHRVEVQYRRPGLRGRSPGADHAPQAARGIRQPGPEHLCGPEAAAQLPRPSVSPRAATVACVPRHARRYGLDLPHPVRRAVAPDARDRRRDPFPYRRLHGRRDALRDRDDRLAARTDRARGSAALAGHVPLL